MLRSAGWSGPRRPLHGRRREKTRPVDFPSSRQRLGRNRIVGNCLCRKNLRRNFPRLTSGTAPRLKTRCIARCTVAFSSRRIPDKICSTNFGGAFHSAEIGLVRPAIRVRMENALIPPPRSYRILRIIADHIQQRSRRPHAHRFGILRHQQHVAALLQPDFTHKLAKSFGRSQIQRPAGFASVPVSAGNQRPLPLLGQFHAPDYFPSCCAWR